MQVVLLVYCLVDCVQSDEVSIRNLPKMWWVVLIILLPIFGGIGWLIAGRPLRAGAGPVPWANAAGGPRVRPRIIAPEDDPRFIDSLKKPDDEHERLLAEWEDDLKRREEQLRADPPPRDSDSPDSEGERPR